MDAAPPTVGEVVADLRSGEAPHMARRIWKGDLLGGLRMARRTGRPSAQAVLVRPSLVVRASMVGRISALQGQRAPGGGWVWGTGWGSRIPHQGLMLRTSGGYRG